jgi:hypothetical protein
MAPGAESQSPTLNRGRYSLRCPPFPECALCPGGRSRQNDRGRFDVTSKSHAPSRSDRRAVHADQRQRGGERSADGRFEPENYLHLESDRGGRTAVVLMSLVRSGRGLGNAPHAYLHEALNRVSTHPASRDDDLSPDRRMLPGQ